MDTDLKQILLDTYRDVARDQAGMDELARMLEEMWQACLDRRAFGYSAHYEAVVWTLPGLFRAVKPLVQEQSQFEQFCRAIPAIVMWLPYDSEEGPLGYTHTIITYPFAERVKSCRTFDEFIAGFLGDRVTVCRECGKDMRVERVGSSYSLTCVCGSMTIC